VLAGIFQDVSNRDQEQMQADVDNFYGSLGAGEANKWYEEAGTAVHGYTNRSFPNVSSENAYLTATYYDNYSFICAIPGAGACNNPYTGPYKYDKDQLPAEIGYPEQDQSESRAVNGQVTGTKVKELETGQWYFTINYYDDRYRLIQTLRQNHLGGVDKMTNVYSFAGWVTRTKTTHTATGKPQLSVVKKMEYDHTGRLVRSRHRVNSAPEIILTKLEYNEIGQLIDKKLHSADGGTTFKQSVDHRYNIRGW